MVEFEANYAESVKQLERHGKFIKEIEYRDSSQYDEQMVKQGDQIKDLALVVDELSGAMKVYQESSNSWMKKKMEKLEFEMSTISSDTEMKYIDFLVHLKDLQQNKLDAQYGPKFDGLIEEAKAQIEAEMKRLNTVIARTVQLEARPIYDAKEHKAAFQKQENKFNKALGAFRNEIFIIEDHRSHESEHGFYKAEDEMPKRSKIDDIYEKISKA